MKWAFKGLFEAGLICGVTVIVAVVLCRMTGTITPWSQVGIMVVGGFFTPTVIIAIGMAIYHAGRLVGLTAKAVTDKVFGKDE